jgi:hypothetical protein
VRDVQLLKKPTEPLLKRTIEAYMKWAEADGGLKTLRYIPLIHVIAATPGQSPASVSNAITIQMQFLAMKYRKFLALDTSDIDGQDAQVFSYRAPPPSVFGFIIMGSLVILTSLDAADPQARVRNLAHFDFSKRDLDVWNAVALAIVVCHCRDKIMAMKDDLEEESASDQDPDA